MISTRSLARGTICKLSKIAWLDQEKSTTAYQGYHQAMTFWKILIGKSQSRIRNTLGDKFLKKNILAMPILLVLSIFAFAGTTPKASAATGPTTVCIAPSTLTTGNVCPSTPPTFVASAGSSLDVNVNMANLPSDGTNSIDISVDAPQSVLSAASTPAGVTVNSAAFPVTAQICINDVVVNGTCSRTDGPGIVHVVVGSFDIQTSNETIFTIHYVVGSGASNTPASIGYAPGCTGTSASDTTTCFTLIDPVYFTAIPVVGATGVFLASFVPEFSVTADPTSVFTAIGVVGTSTIRVSALNGFTSTVMLAATTNSTNLTCTLSSTSISGGSGTSTLSCKSSVAANYRATVTGMSGTLSHNANVTYHVSPPDFSISAAPTGVSTTAGVAGTSTITVSPLNGFTGDVALVADNSACTLTPSTITGGSGTSTLSCTFTSTPTTTVTVKGISGSLSHSATVTYTVTGLPDFTISATPTAVSVTEGMAATSTITISSLNGFTGNVALSSDNNACTLTPATVTSSSGTSTLSCTFTTTGMVTVTVTGTSGSLTHSTTVTIVILTVSIQSLGGTTNQKTVFQFPSERAMFYAQGRTWIFFTNNQISVVIPGYATSTDGQTWAQYYVTSIAGTSANSSTPISAITNGTHVFLAYYQGSYGVMNKPLFIGIGRLNSDGTIAWNSAITAVPATAGQRWYDPNLSLNADGTLFLSYRNATSTDGGGFAFASTASAPYTSWSSPFTLKASADTWRTSWINLNNGQEYVLYSPAGGCLHGRLYNGGFGPEETICNLRSTRYVAFGFDNGTNTPTVIYQESNTERLMIAYRVGGIWQTPTVIGFAETNSLPQWTVTFLPSLAKYYLIYYNYTTGTIWDYNGNVNSWSTRTLLFNSLRGNSSMSITSYPIAADLTNQDSIGFAWTNGDPSTNRVVDINFGAITIVTGPTAPTSLSQLSIQSPVHSYQRLPYLPWILAAILATSTLTIVTVNRKQ